MRQAIETAQLHATAARSRIAGFSDQERRGIENWRRDLVAHINRFKRYPPQSHAAREQGTVEVTFRMDRNGRVLHSSIAKSSGSANLDRAAMEILVIAAPLPRPQAGITDSIIEFIVPVSYRWRD